MVFGGTEITPEYKGGINRFYKFLRSRIHYDADYTGKRAIVSFAIEKDGSVGDVKILRSTMSAAMNKQIIEAVSASPKWSPGLMNGQRARVHYTVPILYQELTASGQSSFH